MCVCLCVWGCVRVRYREAIVQLFPRFIKKPHVIGNFLKWSSVKYGKQEDGLVLKYEVLII